MTVLRRPGSPWRILVREWAGKGGPTLYAWTAHAPGTELDEVVVGKWLHLEQLDTGRWDMHIGGVRVEVTADRDGRATSVSVFGPGLGELDPVEGCAYVCAWTDPPSTVGGQ